MPDMESNEEAQLLYKAQDATGRDQPAQTGAQISQVSATLFFSITLNPELTSERIQTAPVTRRRHRCLSQAIGASSIGR
jgi:hypothetical protein